MGEFRDRHLIYGRQKEETTRFDFGSVFPAFCMYLKFYTLVFVTVIKVS